MTLAGRIVVLRGGRIEQIASPAHIYDDPDNLFVARFIGSPKMNVLPASLIGGRLDIDGCILPLPTDFSARYPDGDVSIGIRPHCLRLSAETTRG